MAKTPETKNDIPVIGALAVKNQLITQAELERALEHCRGADNPGHCLETYFLSRELISSRNMQRLTMGAKALDMRKKEFRFGAFAVQHRLINQSVLTLVLEAQQQDMKNGIRPRLIGDMLVDAGMMTPRQRDYILTLQKRKKSSASQAAFKGGEKGPHPAEGTSPKAPASVKGDDTDGTPPTPGQTDESDPPRSAESSGKPDDGASGVTGDQDMGDAVPPPETPHSAAVSDAGGDTGSGTPEKGGPDGGKPDPPEKEGPVSIGYGVMLEVSEDAMAAFLTKTDEFDAGITVPDITDALAERGIIFGMVSDEMIQGFINSSGFKTKSFRVARGVTAIQGKDARVDYFFDTHYLKAGGLDEEGNIDFKQRGAIPQVSADTVLAEKTPMMPDRQGKTVYGMDVAVEPSRDLPLKFGKGAKLSEDGLKVLADVTGFPKLSMSGIIFVHEEYVSDGDVDYETGHLKYDGNIVVKGSIKSGFIVKGNNVEVKEIDGGIVEAQGHVTVQGGANEAGIYAKGDVTARFVHKTDITCMGNIVVEKEVVDSRLECSGGCIVENGRLVASRVVAKMGVNARNIGSETAEPCAVTVAHDRFVEKEFDKLKARISRLTDKLSEYEAGQAEMRNKNTALQKTITKLAHIQDRSQLELNKLRSAMTDTENDPDPGASSEGREEAIARLENQIEKAESQLDQNFDACEVIEEAMENLEGKSHKIQARIEEIQEEKNNLTQWASEHPGNPVITVTGTIQPGTSLEGRQARMIVKEPIRRSKVMEVVRQDAKSGRQESLFEIKPS